MFLPKFHAGYSCRIPLKNRFKFRENTDIFLHEITPFETRHPHNFILHRYLHEIVCSISRAQWALLNFFFAFFAGIYCNYSLECKQQVKESKREWHISRYIWIFFGARVSNTTGTQFHATLDNCISPKKKLKCKIAELLYIPVKCLFNAIPLRKNYIIYWLTSNGSTSNVCLMEEDVSFSMKNV